MRARGAAGRVGDVGRGSRSRPTRTAGEDLLLDEAPAPTFEEAARSWVAAYAQLGQLRVSTQALYLSALEHYAFPRFGSKPVTTVSRDDIRGLVVHLLGQGRSQSLVRNVVAPIRQTFNQLIEDGAIAMNPAAKIGRFLRDGGDPRARIDPFTVEEEALFLDTAHEHFPRHYSMLLCALRTGLRFGELVGLQWGDLDFKGRFVELPKNKKIRRVDMSRQLAAELQRLKTARASEALAKGWRQIPEWIFCNEDGKPLWKSDFERRVFHKIFARAGLHPLPRPPAHVRVATTGERRIARVREGADGASLDQGHRRHLSIWCRDRTGRRSIGST